MYFCWVSTPLLISEDEEHTIKVQLQSDSTSCMLPSHGIRLTVEGRPTPSGWHGKVAVKQNMHDDMLRW